MVRGRAAGLPLLGPTGGARCGARGGWGPFLTPPPREEKEDKQGPAAAAAGPADRSPQIAALPAVVTEAAAAGRPTLGPLLRARRPRSPPPQRHRSPGRSARRAPAAPLGSARGASVKPLPGARPPARPQPRPCVDSFEPALRPAGV